jgi:hypothetical protein
LANNIFDPKGNYNDDYNVQTHDLLRLNDVNATIYQDDYDQELSVAAAESANLVDGTQAVGNRTNIGPVKTCRKINYEALHPFFLNVKAEVVRQTITNTTQFAHNILAGPNMMKTYKSPFPACNVRCRNEAVATNTIISQVPAVDTGGIKVAQIFVGRDTLVCDVYGLWSESQFINSLLENIRQRGAMDKLISDCAAMDKLISDCATVEISAKVLDVLRYLQIDSWQSEPYKQHQNFAENRWRDLKRMSDWVQRYHGAPNDTWLLCLQYVTDIMNLTASRTSNWKTPLQCLTGQVPDTSILMLFEFYDKVYFKHPADASDDNTSYPARLTKKKGYFVGFSKHVGHALTYKILTNDTRKVLHRSVIRRASDQRNLQIDPDF